MSVSQKKQCNRKLYICKTFKYCEKLSPEKLTENLHEIQQLNGLPVHQEGIIKTLYRACFKRYHKPLPIVGIQAGKSVVSLRLPGSFSNHLALVFSIMNWLYGKTFGCSLPTNTCLTWFWMSKTSKAVFLSTLPIKEKKCWRLKS